MTSRPGDRRKAAPAARSVALRGAVLLLLAGALAVGQARRAQGVASADLADAAATLAGAQARAAQVRSNAELGKALDTLQQHAEAADIIPGHWAARQINLRQQSLTREQANLTLLGTARANGQLLKLEEFDLSVTNADEGLFDPVAAARQPVMLTLRGLVHFPIAGAP